MKGAKTRPSMKTAFIQLKFSSKISKQDEGTKFEAYPLCIEVPPYMYEFVPQMEQHIKLCAFCLLLQLEKKNHSSERRCNVKIHQ